MSQNFCSTCGRPDGAGHTNQECFTEPAAEIPTGHWWEDALLRWVKYGMNPGHFLTAVLSNDLFVAYSRADEFCKADMDLIVKFVYNQLPGDCWGSKERVSKWKGL